MLQPFLWACQNKSHSWKQTNGLRTCLLNHGRLPLRVVTPPMLYAGDGTSRPWPFYQLLIVTIARYTYEFKKQIPKVARVASSCFSRYRRKRAFRGWSMQCFGAFWGISQDWWRNSYHFQDLFARLIGITGNCYNWELTNRSVVICTLPLIWIVQQTSNTRIYEPTPFFLR